MELTGQTHEIIKDIYIDTTDQKFEPEVAYIDILEIDRDTTGQNKETGRHVSRQTNQGADRHTQQLSEMGRSQ